MTFISSIVVKYAFFNIIYFFFIFLFASRDEILKCYIHEKPFESSLDYKYTYLKSNRFLEIITLLMIRRYIIFVMMFA